MGVQIMSLPPIRIIIAGGRDFDDWCQLEAELTCLTGSWMLSTVRRIEVVSGGATGADTLGEAWAATMDLPVTRVLADWDKYGKRAGYLRNEEMAKYAADGNAYGTLCAFWDGKSKGTLHMIDLALKYGLEVHVYRYEVEEDETS
jgi:hypothetical protein